MLHNIALYKSNIHIHIHISENFRLRSRISPERIRILISGKGRFNYDLSDVQTKIWWTLVH